MKHLGFSISFILFAHLIVAQSEQDYGRNKSIGVPLLGSGIIGMPFRFVRENGDQVEFSPAF